MTALWENFWLIQGIGFVAFAADTALCHSKNARRMMGMSIPALLLWALHYSLLAGFTGALMCVATAVRNGLTLACPASAHKYIFMVGIGVISALTALSWQGMISILPFLGSVSYCFSVLKPDCRLHVRLSWGASTFFWLLYGCFLGSLPEVAASFIGLCSVGIALMKQDVPALREKFARVKTRAAAYSAASLMGLFFFVASISAAFVSTISTM